MKLSPTSEVILSNFASINPNLYVYPGNYIKAKSGVAELVVEANLDVEFPVEFGIYDMSKFLSAIDLVEDASLDFNDKSVRIYNDSVSLKYNYADRDALNVYENNPADIVGEAKVAFDLKRNQLDSLKKAASILKHEHIAFVSEGGKLVARVDTINTMNKAVARDTYEMAFDIEVDADFRYVVKLSQLVMIPGDYRVEFSSTNRNHFAKFYRQDETNLTYYLGLQKKESYYNE